MFHCTYLYVVTCVYACIVSDQKLKIAVSSFLLSVCMHFLNSYCSLHTIAHSIERLKKENSSFKRDARDWEMEAKKLRKQKSNLEYKVECLEASCELSVSLVPTTYVHVAVQARVRASHILTHTRLKEQVGVVEAGMYWDMRREYTAMEAEKENAMSEFERMKQEV